MRDRMNDSEVTGEFVCVDDAHYIHLGVNPDTGRSCNSSIGPASWSQIDMFEDGRGWRCIGCNRWWAEMPEPVSLKPMGLMALTKMRDDG